MKKTVTGLSLQNESNDIINIKIENDVLLLTTVDNKPFRIYGKYDLQEFITVLKTMSNEIPKVILEQIILKPGEYEFIIDGLKFYLKKVLDYSNPWRSFPKTSGVIKTKSCEPHAIETCEGTLKFRQFNSKAVAIDFINKGEFIEQLKTHQHKCR